MGIKKILWLEDQYDDFRTYRSSLYRAGYVVEFVASVSDAVEKLKKDVGYRAFIFDIRVLPGKNKAWIELDKQKREENPNFGSNLGFELLYSLFAPDKARVKLDPPIIIDSKKVIVFSVVYDKNEEFKSFGIPEEQIINKSAADLSTLPELIKKIDGRQKI